MTFPQPREGVLRLGDPLINYFLVSDDDGVTLVDAGAPRCRRQLEPALRQIGRSLDDLRAVILTHGDADHKGYAEHLRRDHGVPVYVHAADEELTRTGKGKTREASFLPYLRHGATWKIIGVFATGGKPLHVKEVRTFEDGDVLDVPGRPRVIHAPGHSAGCVAFHFERHGVLLVGDVLFEYNVLTGRTGPQIGPSGFNESSEQALASLERIEGVEAPMMLFGHGEAWTKGSAAAVAAARQAGRS